MIVFFPFFLIAYAVIGYVCIAWVKRRGYSNRAAWAMALLWFPGLLVFDVPFGWAAFRYLCSNEAGHVVFETVKTDGYAYVDRRDPARYHGEQRPGICSQAGIFTSSGEGLFMYRETEVGARIKVPSSMTCFADTPGKYRYTLERRGNPTCVAFEQLSEESKKGMLFNELKAWAPDEAGNPQDWCIGVQRVENFKSRYVLTEDEEPLWLKLVGVRYTTYGRVVDLEQDRVIAQWFSPTWDGGWVSRTFFWFESDHDPVRSCKKDRYTQSRYPKLWYLGALKPINFNKEGKQP